MIQVEKKVPIPKEREKYPFAQMEIGDSFWTLRNVASTAHSWSKNNARGKVRFITRREKKGFRIWRKE